jgi:sugar/nucleoside kinase (ribokinase family)
MKKAFDVIVVGELNIDLILNQLDSFPQIGTEKLAGEMSLTLGSSAAIFASNLSALGMQVAFVAKAGNDIFGRFCIDSLQGKGVDTSMIIRSDDLQTGATIVLNFGDDRAMVTHQGAMGHLGPGDITKGMLQKARHLHFSSYFLQPGFTGRLEPLFRLAKEAGLTTSLDVQWDPAERWDLDLCSLLPHVDIFLPNEAELLHLTRQDSIDKALASIAKDSHMVLVKRGRQGSLLHYNNRTSPGAAYLNDKVVDAIGAGDSFNAGFIFKFLQDSPAEECQQFGNAMGAVSTTAAGGTTAFTHYEEILDIAKKEFGYEQ